MVELAIRPRIWKLSSPRALRKRWPEVETGKDDRAEELFDRNLGYMQLALMLVSVLDVAGDVSLESAKTRAM